MFTSSVTVARFFFKSSFDAIEKYSNDNLDLSVNTDQPNIASYTSSQELKNSSASSILKTKFGIMEHSTLESLQGIIKWSLA